MQTRERLKALISQKGWTAAKLARVLDEKDRHWVTDRLNARVAIKADEIPRIADALGVSPMDFYTDRDLAAVGPSDMAALTVEEQSLIVAFRKLPPDRKAKVLNGTEFLVDIQRQEEEERRRPEPPEAEVA